MMSQGLETHLWIGNHSRELEIEGKPIVLFRCPLCERNFAREPWETQWKAARVGTFRVEYLHESVSQRWVSEPCPGKQAPDIELSSSSMVQVPHVKVNVASATPDVPELSAPRHIAGSASDRRLFLTARYA
jgi:hypothetical protein